VRVYGDDLDTLRQLAEQVKEEIASVPGLDQLTVEAQGKVEELHVRLRPEQLALYGLDRAYVADFVQTALAGEKVSEVLEGQRRFDLVVWLDEPYRTDYRNLGRLQLQLPDKGGRVALSELADIGPGAGPNSVKRDNVRRRLEVRCKAKDRALGSVAADVERRVKGLEQRLRAEGRWPEGYSIDARGGQVESQRRATLLIGLLSLVSVAGMFVVLFMLYPSWRIVLQILNAVPTAFVGGVLALVLTRQELTVASMIGFVSLGGIAARNGILLVSHYFHLMKYEGEGFTRRMILRGSLERLAPVLMTALTAGIALVPLVVVGQAPGREILYPVATVILGGLITSTLCEFLIRPGLFWKFSGRDAERLAAALEREA
jgi:HME family heavy-metal exporter